MKRKSAFTLIEVLVVVAIIALLIAILVPSLSRARAQARRASCATQLHQVGIAMISYMQDSRDRMPHVSFMPSIDPAPLTTAQPIYLADVLKRQLKGNLEALHCPNDRPGAVEGRDDRPPPNTGLSFYQSERSSYAYRVTLAGLTPTEFGQVVGRRPFWMRQQESVQTRVAPATVWFANDYDNFHGKKGTIGARRYVYIDGHVSDYEN